MEYESYCVKCRVKHMITFTELTETSKGQPMAKGKCPECGTTVVRFVSADVAEKWK